MPYHAVHRLLCVWQLTGFNSLIDWTCHYGVFIFNMDYFFLSFPLGVVSLFGNSLLLLVAYRKRSILKPAEFFIVNLAISDVGMTVILFPLATPSFFAHRWLAPLIN